MESNKGLQSAQTPAVEQPLQGGNVAVPGTALNSPQPNILPAQKSGDNDKTKGDAVETAGSKDEKGNTANQPPNSSAAQK